VDYDSGRNRNPGVGENFLRSSFVIRNKARGRGGTHDTSSIAFEKETDEWAIQPSSAVGIGVINYEIAFRGQCGCLYFDFTGISEDNFMAKGIQAIRNRFGATTRRARRAYNTNAHDSSLAETDVGPFCFW
jgi:hypothetical protein